jgi:glycosyltransferase involved in cell wall biosynthesis
MARLDCHNQKIYNGKERLKVIVAIPCLNTQNTIANVVTEARRFVDEVIVVDDGSSDSTAYIAQAAGARVIRHEKNLGKGAAMRTAAENAAGDIIVFIDGDGQHKPKEIDKLLEPIVQGEADFVIGSRFLSGSKISSVPVMRRIMNFAASFCISFVISVLLPISRFLGKFKHGPMPKDRGTDRKSTKIIKNIKITGDYRYVNGICKWVTDCTSGFTALRLENWPGLNLVSTGFQIETEMIFEQTKHGYVIAETPITCSWEGSKSRLSIINDGSKTLLLLVKKLLRP